MESINVIKSWASLVWGSLWEGGGSGISWWEQLRSRQLASPLSSSRQPSMGAHPIFCQLEAILRAAGITPLTHQPPSLFPWELLPYFASLKLSWEQLPPTSIPPWEFLPYCASLKLCRMRSNQLAYSWWRAWDSKQQIFGAAGINHLLPGPGSFIRKRLICLLLLDHELDLYKWHTMGSADGSCRFTGAGWAEI